MIDKFLFLIINIIETKIDNPKIASQTVKIKKYIKNQSIKYSWYKIYLKLITTINSNLIKNNKKYSQINDIINNNKINNNK